MWYLLSELSKRFSPCQVCKPIIDGTLGPGRDEPEVILLIDLWLSLPRVWKRVASQLLRDDAAKVRADLKSRRDGFNPTELERTSKACKCVQRW